MALRLRLQMRPRRFSAGRGSPQSLVAPLAQRAVLSKPDLGERHQGGVCATSRRALRCALLVLFVTRPTLAQVQKVIDLAHDELAASEYVDARTPFVVVMRNRAPAAKYQSVLEKTVSPIPPLPNPVGNKMSAGIDCTALEADIVALDRLSDEPAA